MMIKRAICILLVLMLAVLLPVSASAAGLIQTDQPAGLTIEYQDQGIPLVGVQFRIYQIAEVDAYGELTVAAPFDRYPIRLEDITEDDWMIAASTLEGYILRDGIPADDWGETDEQGRLKFPNKEEMLPQGLYLVMGQGHIQGDYAYQMQSFLIMLPYRNQTTDDWSYEVTVRPKFSRENQPGQDTLKCNVLKIWECSCEIPCYPDRIEIQLLRDGEVFETVILSHENDWRYSWDNLDAAYDWRVVEKVPKGYTVTISRTGNTFVVENTCTHETPTPTEPTEPDEPSGKLPQTGQLWWPVPVLICTGLTLILLGLICRRGEEYGA